MQNTEMDAAAIVAHLFPDDAAAADPVAMSDAVLAERVGFSEGLHWLAEQTGDRSWTHLADAVCSPTLHKLEAFFAAYMSAFPDARLRPTTDDALVALREATKAAVTAAANSDFEFAFKLRVGALIGFHSYLRRRFPSGGAEAREAYGRFRSHLERLPNWVVGGAILHRMRPAWINALNPPANRDEQLVVDAMRDAGDTWVRSIAADAERVSRSPSAT